MITLEIYLSSVVGAGEESLHLLRGDSPGVGAGAGIADGIDCNLSNLLFEFSLIDAELLQGAGDVQLDIVGLDQIAQGINLGFLGSSADADASGNVRIAALCFGLMGIVLDYVRQIDGVGAAMRNMACGESGAGLVCHGMHDAKEGIGECLSGQALSIVHLLSGVHVAIVGGGQIVHDHLDGLDCQRIGERSVQGGYIGLDRMSQSVHAGIGNLFHRQGGDQIGIQDGNIGSNLEIGQGYLIPFA